MSIKKRSELERKYDIMAVLSNGPMKPTHLLYKVNTPWSDLMDLVFSLKQCGLVGKVDGIYRLTQKGFETYFNFKKVNEQLRPIEELASMITAPVTGLQDLGEIDIKDLPE